MILSFYALSGVFSHFFWQLLLNISASTLHGLRKMSDTNKDASGKNCR